VTSHLICRVLYGAVFHAENFEHTLLLRFQDGIAQMTLHRKERENHFQKKDLNTSKKEQLVTFFFKAEGSCERGCEKYGVQSLFVLLFFGNLYAKKI